MGGAVLPRWASDRPEAAVIIDTSGSITPADIDMARAAGTLLARIADVTFYGCDTRPVCYGKELPERIGGGGGTDLRRGIAMAIRDGARAVVLITDCGTPWPTEDDMSAAGVPMVVGANMSAPMYGPDRTGQVYGEPPVTLTTIIPIRQPE
jgi:predicted metal-dependent peptidase